MTIKMTLDIKSKAEAYCRSYAEAVELASKDKDSRTEKMAEALFSHYVQKDFTAFTSGQRLTMGDKNTSVPLIQSYLDKWIELGLGLDISMDNSRVEVVSDLGQQGGGQAFCWITWTLHPPTGSEWHGKGWSWENVYAFRLPPGQDNGHFEFVVNDNETATLLQRIPNFFEGLM